MCFVQNCFLLLLIFHNAQFLNFIQARGASTEVLLFPWQHLCKWFFVAFCVTIHLKFWPLARALLLFQFHVIVASTFCGICASYIIFLLWNIFAKYFCVFNRVGKHHFYNKKFIFGIFILNIIYNFMIIFIVLFCCYWAVFRLLSSKSCNVIALFQIRRNGSGLLTVMFP